MIGALAPVPFIPAALLVTLGLGYAFWVTLRRAAGVARVNAEFDAPLTEKERSFLEDEPE